MSTPRPPRRRVAKRLLTRRTHAVLLTAGPVATTVLTRAGERVVPVDEVPVVDSIGAGDTFTAAFVVWWMATGRGVDDLDDVDAVASAVEAAHQAAALVVRRRGADPPHRESSPRTGRRGRADVSWVDGSASGSGVTGRAVDTDEQRLVLAGRNALRAWRRDEAG